MTPLETFLGKLSGVKKYGQGWRAICPVCGGKNNSKLSVKEGNTGAVLIKCFAGCEVDEIVGAVGMDLTDLFPPRDSQGKPQRGAFRYEAVREMRGELGAAWILLAQIGRGGDVSARDRKSALRLAHKCSTLLQELG